MEFFRGLYNAILLIGFASCVVLGLMTLFDLVPINHIATGAAWISLGFFILDSFREYNVLKRK